LKVFNLILIRDTHADLSYFSPWTGGGFAAAGADCFDAVFLFTTELISTKFQDEKSEGYQE
jgi:hypothetical protein